MRVLYIQTAFVGDLLLSIPTLKLIRKDHPSSEIVLLCRSGLGDVMKSLNLVDQVVEIDKKNKKSPSFYLEKLGREEFDLALCPHESFTSYQILKGVKAQKKVSYKQWWNFLGIDRRIRRPMELPEAMRQIALYADDKAPLKKDLEFYTDGARNSFTGLNEIPESCSTSIEFLLKSPSGGSIQSTLEKFAIENKRFAILAPGSVWQTKRWSLEGFVEVGKYLKTKKFEIVVLGAPDESDVCADLSGQLEGATNLSGKTSLMEAIEIIAAARILICNDSGAMHMASLSETPTLSLFGPTVLEFGYRPWNPKARVEQVDLGCRPCGSHGHRSCPIGNHKCMVDLSANQVINTLKKFNLESL